MLIRLAVTFLLVMCVPIAGRAVDEWTVFEDCEFVPERYFDGDSFSIRTVKKGSKRSYTYIFRLYGADCPESDGGQAPERILEQAEDFRIPAEAVVPWGVAAREFVAKKLAEGPIQVVTRKSKALGQSSRPRYYAFVEVGGEDLAALLVERGLARAFGTFVEYRRLTADQYRRLLERKERTARRNREGIWSVADLPQ